MQIPSEFPKFFGCWDKIIGRACRRTQGRVHTERRHNAPFMQKLKHLEDASWSVAYVRHSNQLAANIWSFHSMRPHFIACVRITIVYIAFTGDLTFCDIFVVMILNSCLKLRRSDKTFSGGLCMKIKQNSNTYCHGWICDYLLHKRCTMFDSYWALIKKVQDHSSRITRNTEKRRQFATKSSRQFSSVSMKTIWWTLIELPIDPKCNSDVLHCHFCFRSLPFST